MSKQLLISIDPGFDSLKVIANGKAFKFPFNAVETDERKMSDYGRRDGFLLYKDMAGATWRVGAYARNIIFENKLHDDGIMGFYTAERFTSEEFLVGVRSAIAMAIRVNHLFEDQADLDLRLIVALPHGVRAKYASTIVGALAGEHRYYMVFDAEGESLYHYTVQESAVSTVSQTIAAILGETSDDKGYINEEKYFYLSNGPTLVIDGGYYTIGIVPVSRGGSVDDAKSESNTAHAMKNVNAAVAEAIRDKRPDIQHYMVEYLLGQNEGQLRFLKDGKAETVNLVEIREKKIRSTCAAFIKYLNKKYDNLLDMRYVLVTGGTGACYYDQMLRSYQEQGLMDEAHMLLTRPKIGTVELPIEYAIACGAYKGLCGKLN